MVRLSRRFTKQADVPHWRPQPPSEDGFGLFRFRSPLLTESRLLSFPPVTEMFQFTGFASTPYAFRCRFPTSREGCPIRRSQSQCSVTSSSGLFAGSHVLHRLSTPRHPPHALINFVTPTRPRPRDAIKQNAQPTSFQGDRIGLPNPGHSNCPCSCPTASLGKNKPARQETSLAALFVVSVSCHIAPGGPVTTDS